MYIIRGYELMGSKTKLVSISAKAIRRECRPTFILTTEVQLQLERRFKLLFQPAEVEWR